MKVTFSGNQSLRAMLAERGVPSKDLGKAVDQIVKLNGLRSARGIPDGTVLTFPSTLTLGDATVRLKKVVGDVASRADSDRTPPAGGRPMGTLGIFAFDELRNGGAVTSCGPATHPMFSSGCSTSACSCDTTSTRRRRSSSSSGCGVSACGPATHPMYSGCSVSACSGGTTPTRRRRSSNASTSVSGCGVAPSRRAVSGCG